MSPVFIFSFSHNRQSIWRGFVCREVHGTSSLGPTICEGDKEKVWRETVVESEEVRWSHYRFVLGQMMPPFTTGDDGHEHKPEALRCTFCLHRLQTYAETWAGSKSICWGHWQTYSLTYSCSCFVMSLLDQILRYIYFLFTETFAWRLNQHI